MLNGGISLPAVAQFRTTAFIELKEYFCRFLSPCVQINVTPPLLQPHEDNQAGLDVEPVTLALVMHFTPEVQGNLWLWLCTKHTAAGKELWDLGLDQDADYWVKRTFSRCYSCCHWRWQKQTHFWRIEQGFPKAQRRCAAFWCGAEITFDLHPSFSGLQAVLRKKLWSSSLKWLFLRHILIFSKPQKIYGVVMLF